MEDLFAVEDDEVQVITRQNARAVSPVAFEEPPVEDRNPGQANSRQARYLGDDEEGDADETPTYDAAAAAARRRTTEGVAEFSLGLDEEVVIKKKRVVARLDEERLLEPRRGVPKLIQLSRERPLHKTLRGKGHTVADMGKVLERYQFWCHEMFPKAKFRDALTMIRKVGNTKRMKMERRRFIDDLLPKPIEVEDGDEDFDFGSDNEEAQPVNDPDKQLSASQALFLDDDEDPAEPPAPISKTATATQDDHPDDAPPPYFEDEEDDLDALEAMYS